MTVTGGYRKRNVRVNTISPGYTMTKLLADLLDTPAGKQNMDRWMGMTPMARPCSVTDLQGGVVFLASELSDMMTGSDLVIDGGYTCW